MNAVKAHPIWIVVRVAVIVFFALPSLQGAWHTDGPPGFPDIPPLVIIGFAVFFLVFGYSNTRWVLKGMIKDRIKKGEDPVFYRPVWRLNPFQRANTYQFYHMAAMAFLISGLCGFVRNVLIGPSDAGSSDWIMAGFLTFVSGSILVGMYLNIFFNKNKFQRYNHYGTKCMTA